MGVAMIVAYFVMQKFWAVTTPKQKPPITT